MAASAGLAVAGGLTHRGTLVAAFRACVEGRDVRTVGESLDRVRGGTWQRLAQLSNAAKGRHCSEAGGHMETREDCLRESAECDRLAQLANTQGTRTLLAVAAFQWRKLAEKAAERQKPHWPFVSEAIRPN
jgi:hypothetical protein